MELCSSAIYPEWQDSEDPQTIRRLKSAIRRSNPTDLDSAQLEIFAQKMASLRSIGTTNSIFSQTTSSASPSASRKKPQWNIHHPHNTQTTKAPRKRKSKRAAARLEQPRLFQSAFYPNKHDLQPIFENPPRNISSSINKNMPTRLISSPIAGERRKIQNRIIAINAIFQYLLLPLDSVLLKLALVIITIVIHKSLDLLIPIYSRQSATSAAGLRSDEE